MPEDSEKITEKLVFRTIFPSLVAVISSAVAAGYLFWQFTEERRAITEEFVVVVQHRIYKIEEQVSKNTVDIDRIGSSLEKLNSVNRSSASIDYTMEGVLSELKMLRLELLALQESQPRERQP